MLQVYKLIREGQDVTEVALKKEAYEHGIEVHGDYPVIAYSHEWCMNGVTDKDTANCYGSLSLSNVPVKMNLHSSAQSVSKLSVWFDLRV